MHEARAFAFVKPANGFPKVLESSALPGLLPGLHVVVLGVCGVQSEALAAQARVRPELSDAYVKKLTGPVEPSCPLSVDLDSKLPRRAERLASLPFEGTPDLVLTAYSVNVRSELECTTDDLLIRLMHGKRVLAEHTFEGSCSGACTPAEKKAGKEELERIKKAVEAGEADSNQLDYNFTDCQTFGASFERELRGLGDPLFIISKTESAPHGGSRTVFHIVGFGCGGLSVSEPFVGAGAVYYLGSNERVDDLEARPSPSGGKRFSLFKPELGADAGTGRWFADVEWLGARCTWKVEDGT
jgi:hypothetical protein